MSLPLAIILILVALGAGYFLGRRRGASTTCLHLFDPEEAQDAGEKGRATIAARIARRKERILERAAREGRITHQDIEDLFCVAPSTARNYLHELVAEGRLRKEARPDGTVEYVAS